MEATGRRQFEMFFFLVKLITLNTYENTKMTEGKHHLKRGTYFRGRYVITQNPQGCLVLKEGVTTPSD